jgi:hypothetical protein
LFEVVSLDLGEGDVLFCTALSQNVKLPITADT